VQRKKKRKQAEAQKSFLRECRAYSEKSTLILPKLKAKKLLREAYSEKSTLIPPK
jgi:histone H3/H4